MAPSSGTEVCRCRLLLTLAWRDWRHAALRLQQVASVTVLCTGHGQKCQAVHCQHVVDSSVRALL